MSAPTVATSPAPAPALAPAPGTAAPPALDVSADGASAPPPPYTPSTHIERPAVKSQEEKNNELKNGFVQYVNGKSCYGKRAAMGLTILNSHDYAAYHCQQFSLAEKREYIWRDRPVDQFYRLMAPQLIFEGQEPYQWLTPSPSQYIGHTVKSDDRYVHGPNQPTIIVLLPNSEHIMMCPKCIGTGIQQCTFCHGRGVTGAGDHRHRCNSCNGTGRRTCTHCQGMRFISRSCELHYSWITITSTRSINTMVYDPNAQPSSYEEPCILPESLIKRHLNLNLRTGTDQYYKGYICADYDSPIDWRLYTMIGTPSAASFPGNHPIWANLPPNYKSMIMNAYDRDHWTKSSPTLRLLTHRILIHTMPIIQVRYYWNKADKADALTSGGANGNYGANSDDGDKNLMKSPTNTAKSGGPTNTTGKQPDQYLFLAFGSQYDGYYENDYPLNCCGCLGEGAAMNCHSCTIL